MTLRDVSEVLTLSLCLQLWMESEESAIRSCPLCQLTFPTGYPDDALIKHIDSHLENSKIWPFFSFFFLFWRTLHVVFLQAEIIHFYWGFSNPAVVWWVCMIIFSELSQSDCSLLVSNLLQCSASTALFQFSPHNVCGRDIFAYFCNRQKLLKLSWREETSWNGPTCALSHARVLFISWSCHASQH